MGAGLPSDTASHQEYYKEPFTKVENGYGFEGVLTVSNEETHIQCHLCGRFYTSLAAHVQHTHKMKAKDYKRRFGLRLTKGLVSPKYSKQMKLTNSNASNSVKAKRIAGLKKGADKLAKSPKQSQDYALENKNIKGLCPEQLIDKIKNVYDMYGADAEKVAELIGGTLIMVNESDDTAMIAGGDLTKLEV